MVKLCDLPLEILLEITERATEPTKDSDSRRRSTIGNLSLVCRYLNGVAARKLFRTYRLQLREKDDSELSGARTAAGPTCFLTGLSLLELHPDGVDLRARLAHLRKKAAFVREIRIVDYGQPPAVYRAGCAHLKEGDRPPPPPAGGAPFDLALMMPTLIEALDTLDGVTSVVFESTDVFRPSVRLPDELWRWLSRRKPGKVSFDGYFAFPDSLGWLPPVGSMSLVMNEEASRVLEVSHGTTVFCCLTFLWANTANRSRSPYARRTSTSG